MTYNQRIERDGLEAAPHLHRYCQNIYGVYDKNGKDNWLCTFASPH
jgi:hypothetical protein